MRSPRNTGLRHRARFLTSLGPRTLNKNDARRFILGMRILKKRGRDVSFGDNSGAMQKGYLGPGGLNQATMGENPERGELSTTCRAMDSSSR